VARDLAIKFNNQFGPDVFTIPEPDIRESVAVVPGIDGQKMSKSYDNHIEIFGDEKETKARIMRVVTDSTPLEAPKDPAKCNVFALYRLFAGPTELQEMEERYRAGGYGYGSAKKALLAKMIEYFAPFRARRQELARNLEYVESVLRSGAERARSEAETTLKKARQSMGLE
jgi:tryptophanyl-tRNA synthetase